MDPRDFSALFFLHFIIIIAALLSHTFLFFVDFESAAARITIDESTVRSDRDTVQGRSIAIFETDAKLICQVPS